MLDFFFLVQGMWEGWNPDSQVLLSWAPLCGRKLPYVFGGDRKGTKGNELRIYCSHYQAKVIYLHY